MKRPWFSLSAVVLALLVAVRAVAGEGQLTPATPADLRAALDARQGRVVLVNFWATWCRPCLKELPALLALEQDFASRGFELLAVSLDEPADGDAVVQPFLTKWFPSLRSLIRSSPDMDSMVSVVDPAWNEVLPTSYVVDRTGRVAAQLQGGKSAAEFEAAILPWLAKP
jgi:thiol-disulfide isomerase/thioredoxin